MEGKKLIATFDQAYQLNIVTSLLEAAGIPSWSINKIDSMYLQVLSNAAMELYVNEEDVERALEIVNSPA